jgi:hypothetical protein
MIILQTRHHIIMNNFTICHYNYELVHSYVFYIKIIHVKNKYKIILHHNEFQCQYKNYEHNKSISSDFSFQDLYNFKFLFYNTKNVV